MQCACKNNINNNINIKYVELRGPKPLMSDRKLQTPFKLGLVHTMVYKTNTKFLF